MINLLGLSDLVQSDFVTRQGERLEIRGLED